MAENIPEMNEIIEDLSVEQKGPAMRRLITQGFKRLTQTVNNAVSTQITDYDAFFKTPRLGPLENGKFSIEEGGFFSDITENPGQPAPANNRCRTRAISLSSATVIRLIGNTSNTYKIATVWAYNTGATVQKIYPTADSEDITGEGGIFINTSSAYNQFRVSFGKSDNTDLNGTDTSAIQNMFSAFIFTDKDLSTENAPADAGAVNALIYESREKTKNVPHVLTWFKNAQSMAGFGDMPSWSITSLVGEDLLPLLGNDFPNKEDINANSTYIIQKERYGTNDYNYFYRYTLTPLARTRIWTGYVLIGGSTINWVKTLEPKPSVKMLIFGTSFSYSTLGLLPAILRELGINVTFGILYIGSGSPEQHIEKFENEEIYDWYSEFSGSKWTNSEDVVTSKEVLNKHKWDYIIVQTGNKVQAEYAEALIEDILDYITYPTSFLFNIPQSYGAGTSWQIEAEGQTKEEQSNNQFLQFAETAQAMITGYRENDITITGHYISDVLPCGTAVQNARQLPVFKEIGVKGYLCFDDNSHLQNGIGTLIPSYAAALKICELIGEKQKVFNIQVDPTDAWLTAYQLWTRYYSDNIPGHGHSQGLNDSNKLLAQKCALQAVRHPYEITNLLHTGERGETT